LDVIGEGKGKRAIDLLRTAGVTPSLRADIVPLEPGDPYLALPLQFAESLRPHLLVETSERDLDVLLGAVPLSKRDRCPERFNPGR